MKKPRKLILKRVRVKKSKSGIKVLRKKSYKSHYLANDTGEEKRSKKDLNSFDKKTAKKLAVYINKC